MGRSQIDRGAIAIEKRLGPFSLVSGDPLIWRVLSYENDWAFSGRRVALAFASGLAIVDLATEDVMRVPRARWARLFAAGRYAVAVVGERLQFFDLQAKTKIHDGGDSADHREAYLQIAADGRAYWPVEGGVLGYDPVARRAMTFRAPRPGQLLASSDLSLVASVDAGGSLGGSGWITAWVAKTGEELFSVEVKRGWRDPNIALSPDGRFAVWQEPGGDVRFCDVRRRSGSTFPGHLCGSGSKLPLNAILASAIGTIAISASNAACVWDLRTQSIVRSIPLNDFNEVVVDFSRDGRELTIATVVPERTVFRTVDVTTGSVGAPRYPPALCGSDECGTLRRFAGGTVRRTRLGRLTIEPRNGPPVELAGSEEVSLDHLEVRGDGAIAVGMDDARRGCIWDARTGTRIWSSSAEKAVSLQEAFGPSPPPNLVCRAGEERYALTVCADRLRPIGTPP